MSTELQQLGKYQIKGVLGKGAMGLVYRAKDPSLNREVALKVITGEEVSDEMKARFQVEARAAAALDHPNIVVVYDLGEERGIPYIAMELLKGEDLRSLMRRRPDLPLKESLEIVMQVCDGLGYAHSRSIIHRDIKPANIHICPDGRVKIVDFGVAKMESTSLTQTGMVIGTPDYMSPEQIQGKTVDSRSDIFSTGVVFYELLTHSKPFKAESITSVIYNIVYKAPTTFAEMSLDVPPDVERVIGRAMAKDLATRYQNINEMASDVRRILSGAAVSVSMPQSSQDGGATKVLSPEDLAAVRPGLGSATGTLQVGESPSQRRQAADEAPTELSPGGAPRRGSDTVLAGSAATRKRPIGLIVGAAAAVVVAGIAGYALIGGESPVPVELVVSPWARIEKIERLDGSSVKAVDLAEEQRLTPVRLGLAPGQYRATVGNPELGANDTFEFPVRGPGAEQVRHVLQDFKPAQAVAASLAGAP